MTVSLKKFEERRLEIEREMQEKLARIAEEERKEKERRVAPLAAKFTTIFQDVMTKALNDRVEELEAPRFRKASIRQRLEAAVKAEIDALIEGGEEEETGDDTASIASEKTTKTAPKGPAKPKPVEQEKEPAPDLFAAGLEQQPES